MNLAGFALNGVLAYVFLLVLVRFSGKRLVRQATAIDLVTALILGELVDKLITGKVEFPQYASASIAIALIHQSMGFLVYKSSVAAGWLSGREQPLVERSRLVREGMRSERMNERAVQASLRKRGTRDLRSIKAADVEISGEVSALHADWAREAQQQDAAKLPPHDGKP